MNTATQEKTEERIDEHRPNGHRSTISLVRELRDDMFALIREEMELGRTETMEKVLSYIRNALFLAFGGAIGVIGLIFITAFLSRLLEAGLIGAGVAILTANWLAPLIVGSVIALIGLIFINKGVRTLTHESPAPQKTLASVKEDVEWMQRKRR